MKSGRALKCANNVRQLELSFASDQQVNAGSHGMSLEIVAVVVAVVMCVPNSSNNISNGWSLVAVLVMVGP